MKCKVLLTALLALVLALPSAAGIGFESILFENFEPDHVINFTILISGDAGEWELRSYGGVPWGRACMRYKGDPLTAADDWFFSPGVALTGGQAYEVRLQTCVSSVMQPYNLAVYVGLAPLPASMTTPVLAELVAWEDYEERGGGFLAPGSGTYYLGFQITGPASPFRLFVDDVNLLKEETDLDLSMGMVKSLFVDPPTYTMGDDTISAFVALANTGTVAKTVNGRFAVGKYPADTELQFTVVGPDGLERPVATMFSKSRPPGAGDFLALQPDSVAGKVVNLWNWYEFDMIGDYTIWATYRNYSDPGGLGAWMGELETDPVVITVN